MIIDDEKLKQILAKAGPLPELKATWEPPEAEGAQGTASIERKDKVDLGGQILDLVGLSREYELLTLGPVYSYAHVDFSIPNQIASEINRDLRWITGQSPIAVADGIGDWSGYLEGVRKDDWEIFQKNLLAVNVVNRPANIYWEVENVRILCVHPELFAPIHINVFVPTGNTISYVVEVSRDPTKLFTITPTAAKEEVKARAKTILEMT